MLKRDPKTGQFLRTTGGWTDARHSAHTFPCSGEALLFGIQHGLASAEIVLYFDETAGTSFDSRIPAHQGPTTKLAGASNEGAL